MSTICEKPFGLGPSRPIRVGVLAWLAVTAWIMGFGMPFKAHGQLNQFQGGKIALKIEGNWSPFGFATNTGARGSMSSITTLYPSASAWFGNPAGLGDLNGASVQSDFFLPGLGLGVSSERTQLLRQNLRVPIQDFLNSGDNHVSDPVYPDIDMSLYQSTNVSGVNLAWGNGHFAFGAGVQQPLQGMVDFGVGGLRVGLALPEDANDAASDSVKFLLSGDVFGRVRVELDDFTMGLAAIPRKGLKVGFAYHRFIAHVDVDGQARLDGVLQRAGQETFFNDPASLYSDDLGAQSRGEIQGEANGFRFGAAWDIWKSLGVDVTASFAESMKLRGQVQNVYHMLPVIDPASDTLFSMDRLNLTKLTLTQAFKSSVDSVRVTLPWDVSASVRASWGPFKMNFDYTYFLRNMGLAFSYADTSQLYDTEAKDIQKNAMGGDSLEVSRQRQQFKLALRQQFALGLQWDQVWMHLGILDYQFEQAFVDETAAWKPDFLPFVPTLNLGYFFPIGPRFTTTVSLFAFPVALFKTSIEYRY
jgi:hypothetical protein